MVQGLGITSLVMAALYIFPIGLPLGIAAWIMGRRDLAKMAEGAMDPNGRKKTRDGWMCGLIGTLLNVLWGFGCVGIVGLALFEESNVAARRPPPPPVVVNPPPWQPPQPPGFNNFGLSGPAGVIVLRRGEKRTVTVTVNRFGNFRGNVTLSVDPEPQGLEVDPGVAVVQPGVMQRSFDVSALADAPLGEAVLTLRGNAPPPALAGEDVVIKITVRVVK
jgi:hypothetical protein